MIGIVYGALLAIGQTDMKRLIAYTSISHFGFIMLGIFAMTTPGPVRLDALHGQPRHLDRRAVPDRRLPDRAGAGSQLIADYGGVQKVAPVLAGTFLVAGLSSAVAARPVDASSASSWCWSARSPLPGARGRRDARHRPGRALHPVDVPADDDRAGAEARRGLARPDAARGLGRSRRCWSRHRRARLLSRSRCSTSSTRRSSRTLQQVGAAPTRRPTGAGSWKGRQVNVLAAAAATFTAPSIEYGALAPMLIVFGAAVVGVLVEAFVPRRQPATTLQLVLAWAAWSALVAVVVALVGCTATTVASPHGRGRRSTARRCSCRARSCCSAFVGVLLDRRAVARRRRRRVRRRRRPRCPGSADERARHRGRLAADRGLPADAVRGRRHAAVPGGRTTC